MRDSMWTAKVKINAHWLQCPPKLFSPSDSLLFPKNWDDRTKLICKGSNFWTIKWPSYFITQSHYKTLGTSFLAFVPKRWELWLSKGTFPSRPFPLLQCYIVVMLVNPVPMLMWIWALPILQECPSSISSTSASTASVHQHHKPHQRFSSISSISSISTSAV